MNDIIIKPEIKDKALKVMEITRNSLCNHCLGRIFFQDLKGSDNQERGETIKKALTESAQIHQFDVKNAERCYLCQNIFKSIANGLIENIKEKIEDSGIEFSTFLVGCRIPTSIIQKEEYIYQKLNSLIELEGEVEDKPEGEVEYKPESIKKEINRETGKSLSSKLEREVDFDNPNLVIIVDFTGSLENPDIEFQINPLFIEGRYRKLVRGIPQTKWPCRKCRGLGCENCNFTGKMYPESVEELISPLIVNETHGTESKFHGAGREDIDVKMLGPGRPFVIEIKEPKIRKVDLKDLQTKINQCAAGKVEISPLKLVGKERRSKIKTSSTNTYKIYRAVVELEGEVSDDDLKILNSLKVIAQRTPLRVAHRRADLIRNRSVRDIQFEKLENGQLELLIECEGGLYIKELISGDDCRTHPSVASLLETSARCVELDVLDVRMSF